MGGAEDAHDTEMKTELFNAKTQKENGTSYCGRIIRSGGLVVFPTETV